MARVLYCEYIHNYYVSTLIFIATYDVQSFDITSTNGEVCGTFIFATNTIAVGVQIEILQNGTLLSTVMITRTLTLDIIMDCIPINITGYYDLKMYDIENDNTVSDSPAIIMNQVFVNEQTTTTTTTTTSTTTITLGMPMSTSSFAISSISTTSTS